MRSLKTDHQCRVQMSKNTETYPGTLSEEDEELLQMKWLKFLIDYLEPRKRASSTAQPVISGKLLYPMLVPIPPLNEQHRIVQRIEELLPLVKGL